MRFKLIMFGADLKYEDENVQICVTCFKEILISKPAELLKLLSLYSIDTSSEIGSSGPQCGYNP